MRILFDHSTPAPLASCLTEHLVTKAKDRGWDRLTNGDLLAEAERAGFDVLLTADNNMRYRQNLTGRRIALVVLSTPQWPLVQLHIEKIAAAVNAATPGSYVEVAIPLQVRPRR
jgi:predicted nuclease of predicted toxin-antitoxin system